MINWLRQRWYYFKVMQFRRWEIKYSCYQKQCQAIQQKYSALYLETLLKEMTTKKGCKGCKGLCKEHEHKDNTTSL